MAQERIDFSNQLQSGHEVLAGASPQAMNVVVDGKGTVLRRPGLSAYSEAPSTVIDSNGIDGLYATLDGNLYATGGLEDGFHKLYRVNGGSSFTYGTGLTGSGRAVFAETPGYLVLTTGHDLYKVVKSDLLLSLLEGSPPFTHSVVANASRLLAPDSTVNKSRVHYSDVSVGIGDQEGYERWIPGVPASSSAGSFDAEARPDPVRSIHENTNDIFVHGATNLELWSPDPTSRYARSVVREYGLVGTYAIAQIDQNFVWLDHLRRFVMSDGRNFDDTMGVPIQSKLDAMNKVDDCFGYRVHMDQIDCTVFTFPSEGQTFAFQKGSAWSQWQGWDSANNNWTQHKVLSHHHRKDTDVPVVGTTDGKVAKYDMNATTDLGDPIVASVTTGFLDRGTDRRKKCRSVRIALSRGTAMSTPDPVAFLSYADAPGKWSDKIPLHLGVADDTDPVITLYSLGWYHRRQWKFEFSGDERLALVSVTEEFDILHT